MPDMIITSLEAGRPSYELPDRQYLTWCRAPVKTHDRICRDALQRMADSAQRADHRGEVDRAVRTITGRHDFELYGSGRTDAGVHASAQVAHLDVATHLPPASLRRALNDELPADINVLDVQVVPHRFHARHSALGRRYLYQIATRRTAFAKPFVWWVKEPLNIQAMRDATRQFVGMRDFQSFAAETMARAGSRSTLVLIDRLDLVESGDLVLVVVEGSHFLWKMVRRIVGVLVEIGRGGLPIGDAATLLATKSNLPARLTAPASGLFLDRVYYAGDQRDPGRRCRRPRSIARSGETRAVA